MKERICSENEKAYAVDFYNKLEDAEFMTKIIGGAIHGDHYENHATFSYSEGKFDAKFEEFERGVKVTMYIKMKNSEKTLEKRLLFDEESGKGNLSNNLITPILNDMIIKPLIDPQVKKN